MEFNTLLVLALIYCFYQFVRSNEVYKIRITWIDNSDPRWDNYTYDEMFLPNLRNWFGLKFPRDSDF